ncbi:hypothetical protein Tco_1246817 [Tanacetum coccineum]
MITRYGVSTSIGYGSIEEVIADKGKKSSMETFTPNDKADYYSRITIFDHGISDLDEYWSDKEETDKNLKIETDAFDYETPLYLTFNEFNYLLKIDSDLLTNDIIGFKTYEYYKDDRIYEWNENVPWVYDNHGLIMNRIWREDGYCNGGNLPGAYHIGNSLHYQDLEWYEALEDSEIKDEALRNKAIMEGLISNDESSNDCWKKISMEEMETLEAKNIDEYWWRIYKSGDLEVLESET